MGRKRSGKSGGNPLILLLPILLILAGGIIWKIMQETKKSRLADRETYNVVLVQDSPVLVSVNKTDKSAVIVYLPGELYVPVSGDRGSYRLKSVYGLGALDNKGGPLLSDTVSDLLGIPVDGYIKLPGTVFGASDDLRSKLLNPALFSGKILSDLPDLDLIRLAWLTVGLRFDKVKKIDLAHLGVTSDIVLADGSTAKSVDTDRLNFLLGDNFAEPGLRAEKANVEVLNSGTTSGIGAMAGRMLTSIGIDVVNVGASESQSAGCQIKSINKFENSLTVKRIAEIFSCQIGSKDPGQADVTVILRTLHPDE